jgi:AcrR family transcriptional regulator
MRKDALLNRERLLDAADAMFREHGLEVSVGEIADAAGVGRGTLFRNFRSKEALIAAIVAMRIREAIDAGRALLEDEPDGAEIVFSYVAEIVERQQENRALLQAVTDEMLLGVPELAAVHADLHDLLDDMLELGRRAGSIRAEATVEDLMALVKGLCIYPSTEQPLHSDTVQRHLDLVRAALTTPEYSRPLRESLRSSENHQSAGLRGSGCQRSIRVV